MAHLRRVAVLGPQPAAVHDRRVDRRRDPPARRLLRDRAHRGRGRRPVRREGPRWQPVRGRDPGERGRGGRLEGSTTGGQAPVRAGDRRADRGGWGAVRGGLTPYGSTRTSAATGTGTSPCRATPVVPCLVSRVSNREASLRELRERIDLRALARRPLLVLLGALAAIELVRLAIAPNPVDMLVLVLLVLVGVAGTAEREEVAGQEGSRRTEAESFARILRGLARSVSPDAIVDAIVEELGIATGADHVAVVRRRPESRSLEAILSPTRPGAPDVTNVAAALGARGPGRRRGAVRARRRGGARPAAHGRPHRARPRRRPAAHPAGHRRGPPRAWRLGVRRPGVRAPAAGEWASRPCPPGPGRGTPSLPARAPSSGSPTASPTA